jgi:hypothetical protein
MLDERLPVTRVLSHRRTDAMPPATEDCEARQRGRCGRVEMGARTPLSPSNAAQRRSATLLRQLGAYGDKRRCSGTLAFSPSCDSGKEAALWGSITLRVASSQGTTPATRPGPKTQRGWLPR